MPNATTPTTKGFVSQKASKPEKNPWWVWAALIVCFGTFPAIVMMVVIPGEARRAAHNQVVQAKYQKWLAYRDTHCNVSKISSGKRVVAGKQNPDNILHYVCTDNTQRQVSMLGEADILAQRGELADIPVVP